MRVKVSNLSNYAGAGSSAAPAVQHGKGAAPWLEAEQRLERSESVAESGRLYVRNLPYIVTEDKLKEVFSNYG